MNGDGYLDEAVRLAVQRLVALVRVVGQRVEARHQRLQGREQLIQRRPGAGGRRGSSCSSVTCGPVRKSQNTLWPSAEQRKSRILRSLASVACSPSTRSSCFVGGYDWMSEHHVSSSRRVATRSRGRSLPHTVGQRPRVVRRRAGLSRRKRGTRSSSRISSTSSARLGAETPMAPADLEVGVLGRGSW